MGHSPFHVGMTFATQISPLLKFKIIQSLHNIFTQGDEIHLANLENFFLVCTKRWKYSRFYFHWFDSFNFLQLFLKRKITFSNQVWTYTQPCFCAPLRKKKVKSHCANDNQNKVFTIVNSQQQVSNYQMNR